MAVRVNRDIPGAMTGKQIAVAVWLAAMLALQGYAAVQAHRAAVAAENIQPSPFKLSDPAAAM